MTGVEGNDKIFSLVSVPLSGPVTAAEEAKKRLIMALLLLLATRRSVLEVVIVVVVMEEEDEPEPEPAVLDRSREPRCNIVEIPRSVFDRVL